MVQYIDRFFAACKSGRLLENDITYTTEKNTYTRVFIREKPAVDEETQKKTHRAKKTSEPRGHYKVAQNEIRNKNSKAMWIRFPSYKNMANFEVIFLEHFIKHKHLSSSTYVQI